MTEPMTVAEVAARWRVISCEGCGVGVITRDRRQRFCSKSCAKRNAPKRTGSRFWLRVRKTETCWLWTGATNHGGYGHTARIGGTTLAHRVAWFLTHGTLPDLELDHLCRVPACVNPAHLEPVTGAVNRSRVIPPVVMPVTHCRHGHPFDEANTRFVRTKHGLARACRACNRESVRRYKASHR